MSILNEAAWSKTKSKTKSLQRQLNFEREKLFENYDETAAKTIWRTARGHMERLEFDLLKKARRKYTLATPYNPPQEEVHHNHRTGQSRSRKRRFTRNLLGRTAPHPNPHQASLPLANDENLPDLQPINLTSGELSEAEQSLLVRGPAFCPAPKDVNWQKTIDDLDKFERRIRLAVFHHGKDSDESNQTVDERLPSIPSTNNWMPPKSSFPEVELFLNNVKKDILEPKNLRRAKDNLTKEERLALSKLKSSDNVFRIQDKGSRFVIVSKNEYQDKMFEQLNNNLHYDKLNYDPTMEHFEKIKNWGRDWLGKGQISQEIATWVANLEPKPGVAFGNVKSHKEGNPLRLITSCCGTAIERLSAFTEFYLKPLAQNLPSFVKDTTDFINKIEILNSEKGPLPPGCLLVSWDVVAMFPNIDNNLGISAVRKALDSRSDKFPSTDCIVEAIEICLQTNNCQFSGKNFVQKHGTAMGPKNACSYADLAMGLIDEKAKSEGAVKPMLWWRYRDDVFDIWPHGLPKLLEFTEYINSLYPTIKFELVYSEHTLNVLDLTLHLQEGFIKTDIYAKPTDSHLYLPFSSSHPAHCKRAIPYGVALRIRRNCSSDDFLNKRCAEYKGYLKSQGYNAALVDKQFDKALSIERSELLKKKAKPVKRVFPLVLDYNPILPDIQRVIKKHAHLLRSSPELLEIFPSKSIFPAYRRTKNLKDILAPSKFRGDNGANQAENEMGGCFKCCTRCDLCKNFLIQDSKFKSFSTGRVYKIKQKLSCSSKNVVYLASCNKCKLQYVGSTTTEFKVRFRNHKSSMLTNKKTCELAVHFNCTRHEISEINFIVIEQITSQGVAAYIDKLLLTREAYWTSQLFTLSPHGLNKRREFRSKNRVRYNT